MAENFQNLWQVKNLISEKRRMLYNVLEVQFNADHKTHKNDMLKINRKHFKRAKVQVRILAVHQIGSIPIQIQCNLEGSVANNYSDHFLEGLEVYHLFHFVLV